MRSKHILILAIISLFTIFSCSKDEEYGLLETIFIEDPYFPGLPIYSEWGYNTFGAYIDRKPFISTNEDLPSKIYVNNDTLEFILRGKMNYYSNVDLIFSIIGYSPKNYKELIILNNKTIDLKETGCFVTLKIDQEINKLKILEGEIIFKKTTQLYIDENDESSRTIMAGYFNLKIIYKNEPVAISYGRFDLGFGYENFFNLTNIELKSK